MSAEAIARVVQDLRAGRARASSPDLRDLARLEWPCYPVVDCTPIYDQLIEANRAISLYDHRLAPPWEEEQAALAYVNGHGNVIVATVLVLDSTLEGNRWETAEPIDWADVRWRLRILLFIGGRGGTGPFPTTGPVQAWDWAVAADGSPLDLHWTQLEERYPMSHWDMAQLVVLGALDLLNCRNVEVVEPLRQRAERRRVERTGVRVTQIAVRSIGAWARAERGAAVQPGVPLTSVRGHFAHYGPEYDRALLFGRYAGRFWRPQHARGSAEHGEVEHSYQLGDDTGHVTTDVNPDVTEHDTTA